MFIITSKSKRDGAAWVWVSDCDNAITAIQIARHLHSQGYLVKIDCDSDEV